MWLVVARAHIHDGREVARLEQADAGEVSGSAGSAVGRDSYAQEAENVELVGTLYCGRSEGEDGPGKFEECNVKGCIDLRFS